MTKSDPDYDVVIIGAGHNGLVCAWYLARAGLRVRICERRAVVGGAAVTEEFHPGFRNSTASYTVSLLDPTIASDMGLKARGLEIVSRPFSNFLPTDDGRYLLVGGGEAATRREVAKFSKDDAERLPAYYARLDAAADALRAIAGKTPPNPRKRFSAATASLTQLAPLLGGDAPLLEDVFNLFTQDAGSFLDGWFESDPIKAVLGFDAVVGNFESPYAAGSAYVMLHHVFGEVNGVKGAWGHAIGGMGAITTTMAAACEEAGVEISLGDGVSSVLLDGDRAVGVRLASGADVRAARIAANCNLKLLYDTLINSEALPAAFRQRMKTWRSGSGTVRMNVALSELPDFTCLPGTGDHLKAGIVIAPSLGYMDRAYVDARRDGWSRRPIVEMLIPSTVDDTLAPKGAHVASLFCQQFSPTLPDGASWADHREEVADLVIDTVNAYAPNFRQSVIARRTLTPDDLEAAFGLVGGDIFHGAMSLNQIWAARPALGYGDYRGALAGLYHCGAGAHPGGGVTGLPGRNAAREILRDAKRRFAR